MEAFSYSAAGTLAAHLHASSGSDVGILLRELNAAQLDRLPLPGGGGTLARWQALAVIAEHDLALAKIYEGHTDALAIMAELHAPSSTAESTWGMWAAEAPNARLHFLREARGTARLRGRKAWCSGANAVTHALVTAWDEPTGDGPFLIAVSLDQPGIRITDEGWHAVGMRDTKSVDVLFDRALGRIIGGARAYLTRPGFWHGGAGIAACWYGGTLGLAEALRSRLGAPEDPYRVAHLGAIDAALNETAAALREAARWIDARPQDDAMPIALRVRVAAESAATLVLNRVGRALGAAPFCRDAAFARRAADLPVFVRQSHAEHDLAALGVHVAQEGAGSWAL